jgi:putative hemolysin
LGILGATVMPHNLYLHSSIVQTRRFGKSREEIKEAIKHAHIDSTVALTLAAGPDPVCLYHALVVVDHEIGEGADAVVGTYRLIREEAAEKLGHFYSSDEYDISKILAYPGRKLELGRSCVGREHRGRAAMQLLWRGIAAYVDLHRIELMFGCASLPGTDPEAIAAELSYLYANHLAPAEICPRALAARYVDMQRRDMATLDARRVLASLPPLMKGYLRLGGFVGDGAVIDTQFNTTDVAVVVMTELVTDKYTKHYERQRRD